jgi:hypothetical protein
MSICAAFGADRGFDAAQAGVHGFDGFHSRLDLARVPDHIRIGEVDDNYIKRP